MRFLLPALLFFLATVPAANADDPDCDDWAGPRVEDCIDQRAAALANEIAELVAAIAADYPAIVDQVSNQQVSAAQADETVAQLIAQLTALSKKMNDSSDFAAAIEAFTADVDVAISEAEASNNQALLTLIPSLNAMWERLEAGDAGRAETAIRARNLIRQLEQDRRAIVTYIRVGELTIAADLMASSLSELEEIVDTLQSVEAQLREVDSP